ncbi:hypothetical protein COLO4_22263 [Corchorus olitorius]|uniref:Polyadenylate-binding protein n=1 Tax=Corchorus olitorius TaxID=93759 RepID=A0A1R3INC0_9ROSI|nr:hypothetical protein COLO4_22263 [Corchorus olitorius]
MAVPSAVSMAAPAVSLYVGDLHPDISDGQLYEAFNEFKSLASVRVCRDSSTGRSLCYGYVNFISLQEVATSEDGRSKGYGFVQFETEESANAAIENLNGSTIGDKQIYVGKFMKKSDRVLPSPDVKYTNLYMKNLDTDITEEFLVEKFSQFGKIASLAVAKEENGASRGFGFVNFENPDDAKRAMEAMNGKQLGSKVLYVARAQKKAEREQILRRQFEEKRKEQIMKYKASNVYVKNIDDDVTDEELREHFSQCGIITSAKLMRDDKGMSKGFGFVCFSNPEEATKAVSTFHGHMFHRKPLYVAIAQRKEDRQAQLQLQYAQRMAGLAGPPTAVLPGGYPPLYYTAPTSIAQVPPRPGMMYQPLGLRPGWRSNGFAPPTRPVFQPSALPMGGSHTVSYVPQLQQPTQSYSSSKDQSNPQRVGQAKYIANGRAARDVSKGSGVQQAASNSVSAVTSQGSEMLSSMLAAASPEQQKTILGERLYPLVQKHQPDLVPKITGMLLEMDNSELLLLLESPESLASKVEEAVEVLKLSNAKVPGQDATLHSNFMSAGVAVN